MVTTLKKVYGDDDDDDNDDDDAEFDMDWIYSWIAVGWIGLGRVTVTLHCFCLISLRY